MLNDILIFFLFSLILSVVSYFACKINTFLVLFMLIFYFVMCFYYFEDITAKIEYIIVFIATILANLMIAGRDS